MSENLSPVVLRPPATLGLSQPRPSASLDISRLQLVPYTQMWLSRQLVLSIVFSASRLSANPVPSGCSANAIFGAVFLSNGGDSLSRGPLPMVLPEDSGYALDSHRHRRHVVCGRTDKKAEMKTFEQRAVCSFHYVINKNEKRIPSLLEEVECDCARPSHLSTYTEIRCQAVKYRMPVMLQDDEGKYHPVHEELTLACIPVAPKQEEDFEIINLS